MSRATDINTLARFLAGSKPSDLATRPVPCIVICISAILPQLDKAFSTLISQPSYTPLVVLCGGIGHSTQYLYDAVTRHPRYHVLQNRLQGLAEARVAEMILREFHDVKELEHRGCRVLIEDRSTNCGANAIETCRLLWKEGVDVARLGDVVLVQDPTMMVRTRAGFEKVFVEAGWSGSILEWPIFVPQVEEHRGKLSFVAETLNPAELWDMDRFVDLVMGEVPRLMDNETGYGPQGKGFIPHVDVPDPVEEAWLRLRGVIKGKR